MVYTKTRGHPNPDTKRPAERPQVSDSTKISKKADIQLLRIRNLRRKGQRRMWVSCSGLLQTPPMPKHRTPPFAHLRCATFVKQAVFLTASPWAFRFTPSTNTHTRSLPFPGSVQMETFFLGADSSTVRYLYERYTGILLSARISLFLSVSSKCCYMLYICRW